MVPTPRMMSCCSRTTSSSCHARRSAMRICSRSNTFRDCCRRFRSHSRSRRRESCIMEERERQIPWDEVLALLVRRKKLIGMVVAIGCAAAVALTWMEAPVYRASATLMVTSERAHIAVSPDANSGSVVDRMTEQDLNSEAELLRSLPLVREVLDPYRDKLPEDQPHGVRRVIAALGQLFAWPQRLYQRLHHVAPPSPFERWVDAVAKHVMVTPIAKSDLIEVAYESGNPQWSARFINDLTEHHLARRARRDQLSEPQRFFLEQRELLNKKVIDAETALREFARANGIDSDPAQRKALRAQVIDLEKNLGKAETELAESSARANFIGADLPNHPRVL